MKFTVEIELGNEAMKSFQDIRDALKTVSGRLGGTKYCLKGKPSAGDGSTIMDDNGNTVGKWSIGI